MAHSPLYKGSLTLRPRHAFLQPRDQDLMKLGSRGQTLRPGIHASAGHDREQLGGGGEGGGGEEATIKKILNVDIERSFRETCAFFRSHSLYGMFAGVLFS